MSIMSKWEKAGEITVDAGLCWVGDPCYVLHKDEPSKSIGETWLGFVDKLGEHNTKSFEHDSGAKGLGVVVQTGHGDGVYNVEVQRTPTGRIVAVRVVFISEAFEEGGAP